MQDRKDRQDRQDRQERLDRQDREDGQDRQECLENQVVVLYLMSISFLSPHCTRTQVLGEEDGCLRIPENEDTNCMLSSFSEIRELPSHSAPTMFLNFPK